MRTLVLVLGLAACGPKASPLSPLDHDDPRAAAASATSEPTVADASPAAATKSAGPPVRVGTIARAALRATLDAHPAAILRCVEVAAVQQNHAFVGWRLVRFVETCASFDEIDVSLGDVLMRVNGRVLMKPTDLADLWSELYTADEIVADLQRGDSEFSLRFAITPSASTLTPAPPAPEPAPAPLPVPSAKPQTPTSTPVRASRS